MFIIQKLAKCEEDIEILFSVDYVSYNYSVLINCRATYGRALYINVVCVIMIVV